MSGHGGARKGAGRPAIQIDKRRVLVLRGQGLSIREIAERFEVTQMVIRRVLKQGLPA
jgi:transposase